MKTILLVILMLGTLISYANENIEPTVKVDVRRVKVEFKSVKKGQSFTIKDKHGISLYNQKIKKSGNYSRTFNLTYLKDGLYTTELEKDFEIIVKKMNVKNGYVTFLKKETVKIFKPVIRTKNDLLLISKINFNNYYLKIDLYYKNNVIFSEKLNGKDLFNRVYKLSKTEKGLYKVVINTDNRTYIKSFNL